MDRLHKLSEDLYSEFDPSSESYWPNVRAVDEAIEGINDVFERNRDDILAERKYCYGVPVTKDVERLRRLLDPVISDPFIPDEIRSAVVDLLDNRIHVLQSLYLDEFEKYSNNLAKGKHEPFTELDDLNRIHNRIVEQQRLRGCGIARIQEEVHEIRALIQDYFDSFNPHRRWWQGKRARPGKKQKTAIDSWRDSGSHVGRRTSSGIVGRRGSEGVIDEGGDSRPPQIAIGSGKDHCCEWSNRKEELIPS